MVNLMDGISNLLPTVHVTASLPTVHVTASQLLLVLHDLAYTDLSIYHSSESWSLVN